MPMAETPLREANLPPQGPFTSPLRAASQRAMCVCESALTRQLGPPLRTALTCFVKPSAPK
eukprot:15249653-Alexandrium_andersonii.AAC.1